jgi:hypothetical protein
VQCSLGILASGSTATVQITATLGDATQFHHGNLLLTQATVTTSSLDAHLANNSGQLKMPVHQPRHCARIGRLSAREQIWVPGADIPAEPK